MTDLQTITLRHDGKTLLGELALPAGSSPCPGVLVFPNAFGLGAQVREAAMALARRGYVALACDMYGDAFYSEDQEAISGVITPLFGEPDLLRARTSAWHALLAARSDVQAESLAALGYCFGGLCALEHARAGADIKAAISFHGLLSTSRPAARSAIKGHVAIFTGAKDPHVPADHVATFREEMIACEARWQITEFGEARHAFTDRNAASPERGRAYDPVAHAQSWDAAMGLLEFVLPGARYPAA